MPAPNAVFTELVTTTFRRHKKQFADNLSNNNAYLAYMMKRGRKKLVDGGNSLVCPLDYGFNNTYQRYSGYDPLNITAQEVLSAAEYVWRQIAISVVASGEELRKNKGESKIIDLAKSRMTNAMRTWKNNFSSDLYGDGTLPNQIDGLAKIVSDLGTGTVGGINSTTFSFWQSLVQKAATPRQGGSAIVPDGTAGKMESLMLPLWLDLVRGSDKPTIIVADNNYYSFYENGQVAIKRYTGDGPADGGFPSLKYKGVDVIFDGNSGISDNRMYFLNLDYYELMVHEDADMEVLDQERPYNQDSSVIPIIWMGNNTCSNRRLQGVILP